MLGSLVVAALLSLTDPAGDANGNGNLSAPTATLMREREVFDIISVSVPDDETFGLSITLGRVSSSFPQAILEFYLSDADSAEGPPTGTTALLPGSGMRLPKGQGWSYAVRIIGEEAQLFDGRSGAPRDITASSGVRLTRDGTTLTLSTRLPLPRHFSLYGMSGSFDPLSQTGWRQLRETASPWGFAGTQGYPVLDVVAERPALQLEALRQGVLPEIRASFSEGGWLLLSGAGVVLALGGLTARIVLGRRRQDQPPVEVADVPGTLRPVPEIPDKPPHDVTSPPAPPSGTPLSPFDTNAALDALRAVELGEAKLAAPERVSVPELESVTS